MDKVKVIKRLNLGLERELGEVVRYMHQSFWVKGRNAKRLRAFFREQSTESMDHATRLGEQIVALGGKPVVRILEIYEPRALSDKALLLECLQHEQEACDLYTKLLPLVQDDPGLTKVIAGLVREESGHMAGIRRLADKL